MTSIEEKLEKLKPLSDEQRSKLIYEWVKTKCIDLKEYLFLTDQISLVLKKIPAQPLNDFDDHDYELIPKFRAKE